MNTVAPRFIFLLTILAMGITSCINPPDFPIEPVLTYEGTNKDALFQNAPGFPNDTLEIYLKFTDGDGDIDTEEDQANIDIKDSKGLWEGVPVLYSIPAIPEEGTGNGIRGDLTLRITNGGLCCVNSSGILCQTNFPAGAADTISFTIQVTDNAGNKSNIIRTDVIELMCTQ
ncbi:MAG: hypothetical protein AAGJ82_13830 [Bacteroidota bacterium]